MFLCCPSNGPCGCSVSTLTVKNFIIIIIIIIITTTTTTTTKYKLIEPFPTTNQTLLSVIMKREHVC